MHFALLYSLAASVSNQAKLMASFLVNLSGMILSPPIPPCLLVECMGVLAYVFKNTNFSKNGYNQE